MRLFAISSAKDWAFGEVCVRGALPPPLPTGQDWSAAPGRSGPHYLDRLIWGGGGPHTHLLPQNEGFPRHPCPSGGPTVNAQTLTPSSAPMSQRKTNKIMHQKSLKNQKAPGNWVGLKMKRELFHGSQITKKKVLGPGEVLLGPTLKL